MDQHPRIKRWRWCSRRKFQFHPPPRQRHQPYSLGGNNGANDLSSLWRFSTQSETWRLESPDGVTPPGLSAAAGVVLDARRLMFFGGSSSKVPQTTAYIYNAATNEWSIEGSLVLPFALQGMTASSFNQSAVATACRYADTGFSLCTPVNRTMVLLYGGAQPVQRYLG
ncbi:hypothetical protein BC829DRAFT_242912 [Chytridium lagenaria]|nr:hypothetical protein BC829DRAFT_242912 [Chytridium lagenaria]